MTAIGDANTTVISRMYSLWGLLSTGSHFHRWRLCLPKVLLDRCTLHHGYPPDDSLEYADRMEEYFVSVYLQFKKAADAEPEKYAKRIQDYRDQWREFHVGFNGLASHPDDNLIHYYCCGAPKTEREVVRGQTRVCMRLVARTLPTRPEAGSGRQPAAAGLRA